MTTFICNTFHNPWVLCDCLKTLDAYAPAPAVVVSHEASQDERRIIEHVCDYIEIPTKILWLDDVQPPTGFNEAVKHVDTEYVGLFNDDVMFIPHSPVWEVLEEAMTPDVGMAGCATNFSATAENILRTDLPDVSDVLFLTGATQIMRTDDYIDMGGYDPTFDAIGGYWDIDLCIRVLQSGKRIVLDKRAYYHHCGSTTIVQTPNRTLRGELAINNLVRKHGLGVCEDFLSYAYHDPTYHSMKEAVA